MQVKEAESMLRLSPDYHLGKDLLRYHAQTRQVALQLNQGRLPIEGCGPCLS